MRPLRRLRPIDVEVWLRLHSRPRALPPVRGRRRLQAPPPPRPRWVRRPRPLPFRRVPGEA